MWVRFFRTFARLFSADLCAACDSDLRGSEIFCAACAPCVNRVQRVGPPRSEFSERADSRPPPSPPLCAVEYGGAVATALQRLKYSRRSDLARPLGKLFSFVHEELEAFAPEVLVPVPLHRNRLYERGYNQAGLLAHHLGRELGISVVHRALARVRETRPQVGLSRDERLRNVESAFFLSNPKHVRGRRVVVVDDVATTGATLRHCHALLEEDAAAVLSLALARAT